MKKLIVEELSISFGGIKAVEDLSFSVDEGEIYGIIGPNGAGKTTIFNCISKFYNPDKGKILFEGNDITKCKTYEVISKGIARTFQNVELFKFMTVMDNLLVGQHVHIKHGTISGALNLPWVKKEEKMLREKAEKILKLLQIENYKDIIVSSLPYGIQKKVEIARALVSEPRLILLDEPAAGMNPSETKDLAHLIKKLRDEFNMTILLIEHDMSLVMDICERICVVNFGKKLAEGNPEEIRTNPLVIEAYLGVE